MRWRPSVRPLIVNQIVNKLLGSLQYSHAASWTKGRVYERDKGEREENGKGGEGTEGKGKGGGEGEGEGRGMTPIFRSWIRQCVLSSL